LPFFNPDGDKNGHHGFHNWRGSPPGSAPDFPSVVSMGTKMYITGSTIVGGSTPELLSLNADVLPFVLPKAGGRTFPFMGGSRTHILAGDLEESYLDSFFFRRCGQIAIATTVFFFAKSCPNFWQSDFLRHKVVRPGRMGGGYLNGIAR